MQTALLAPVQDETQGALHCVPAGPRVLFVATSRNDGGIERYSVRLAACLRAQGTPLAYACEPEEIIHDQCRAAGIPARPLSIRNSADVRAARALAHLIRTECAEIVHVHSRRDYLPALGGVLLARQRTRHPVRLLLHAHMLRPLGTPPRLAGWAFARCADGVLAVSEAVRARVLQEHDLPASFVRLLHNGVDLDAFALPGTPVAREWRQSRRREWGLEDDALVVGMIGRLDAKGQAALVEAAPALLARCPRVRIVLVGADGVPGERARLTAQAAALGIGKCVHFTGPRDDVPAVLAACDLLAHLPQDEAFGLSLAEGMAAGLPAVATDIGGCREVVMGGVTGLLVPPGDLPALCAALSRLLLESGSDALRARMGRAGRLRAEQEFSLTRQTERLRGLYQHLCPLPR